MIRNSDGAAICFRPANADDQRIIRRLVWAEKLNPFQLTWKNFRLACLETGPVIGCAQVKQHFDGTRELASLVVLKEWRNRGIARALVEGWLADSTPPLYLTCRATLQTFYERFGFRALTEEELPPYFARIWQVFRWLRRFAPRNSGLSVMRWDGPPS